MKKKTISIKYWQWLVSLSGYLMKDGIEMKEDDFYKGYYNAGYTPQEIRENIDNFHNPGHP